MAQKDAGFGLMRHMQSASAIVPGPPVAQPRGPPCVLWGDVKPHGTHGNPHGIHCRLSSPQAPGALCAFADPLALLPDPRDRRGVRDPQAVLLGTLLVALAGGANNMAAVAAFTHDHQAWFRLWRPLGERVPTDDTDRLWLRRRDPETALKAALLLLDGTRLPGLRELILALDGQGARRSGDLADGLRPLHRVSAFLVREGLTVAPEPCDAKSNEITALPRRLDRIHREGAVVTLDATGGQGQPADPAPEGEGGL